MSKVLNIATQATTVVDTGVGILRRIVIPTPVANATVKVYDHASAASGTVLLDTITMPAALLSSGPVTIELGVDYALGVVVVTGAATMPLTVVYDG